jgi:hypothetical protein
VARFRHEVGSLTSRVGVYRRWGAPPRRGTPAPMRRLWPCRRVDLRALPRPARAMCAAVLRTLRGAGAVARAPLCGVQRAATGICECACSARVRRRCTCLRRIMEGARPTRPDSRRRRSRRRCSAATGRGCHLVRSRRPRPGARTGPCLRRCPRLRALRCLVDSAGCAAATPAGHRSPTRPTPGRTSWERGARILGARPVPAPGLSRR